MQSGAFGRLRLLPLVFCLAVPSGTAASQEAAGPGVDSGRGLLILADFDDLQDNSGSRSNTLGRFGTWSATGTQNCRQAFVNQDALDQPEGRALRLTFSVEASPHYGGWYLFTSEGASKGLDLRRYDRLGFFLKGNSPFILEVKDSTSRDDGSPQGVAEYWVTSASDTWQQIEIPWYMFSPKDKKTVMDWGGIRQFVIVFSNARSEPEGEIVIDHLYVSRGTPEF